MYQIIIGKFTKSIILHIGSRPRYTPFDGYYEINCLSIGLSVSSALTTYVDYAVGTPTVGSGGNSSPARKPCPEPSFGTDLPEDAISITANLVTGRRYTP